MTTAYPLAWPQGWPRARARKPARFSTAREAGGYVAERKLSESLRAQVEEARKVVEPLFEALADLVEYQCSKHCDWEGSRSALVAARTWLHANKENLHA